jgi:AraC-like DNA-binding protein
MPKEKAPSILRIKNMVCPRCILSVKECLEQLEVVPLSLDLGVVELREALSTTKKQQVAAALEKLGFELLEDRNAVLVSRIKDLIVEQIHYTKEALPINFSSFLAERLQQEYTSLSRLFSSVEGITIERFITAQKIEKVKELISYNTLSFSEIAFQLNYSSVAHLSSQFKKETGMTPSAFRQMQQPARRMLDDDFSKS